MDQGDWLTIWYNIRALIYYYYGYWRIISLYKWTVAHYRCKRIFLIHYCIVMDNLTTKVFETEFWFWHYTVLIYDNKDYELYEMNKPLDSNWINMRSDYWRCEDWLFISESYNPGSYTLDEFWKEITIDEFMDEKNLDIRTAIKNKQENFYQLPY